MTEDQTEKCMITNRFDNKSEIKTVRPYRINGRMKNGGKS